MLAKLRIRTSKGEEIKLNDVEYINMGNVVEYSPSTLVDVIFIGGKTGTIKFDLKDITSIAFDICGEQRVVSVSSVISAKAVD